METSAKYTVGQEVYIVRYSTGLNAPVFNLGRVTKVTPSGKVDVMVPWAEGPIRFRADGKEEGIARYAQKELDTIPVADRRANLARLERAKEAVAAIRAIQQQDARSTWSREDLLKVVENLEALVRTAREKVEAI